MKTKWSGSFGGQNDGGEWLDVGGRGIYFDVGGSGVRWSVGGRGETHDKKMETVDEVSHESHEPSI